MTFNRSKLNAAIVVACALLLVATAVAHFGGPLAASARGPAKTETTALVTYDKQQPVAKLYFSLALLPADQRRAYYNHFTEAQRKAVWALHLTMTQLDIETPTDDQLAVFQKLALMIRRTNFTDIAKNDAALAAESKQIEAEAIAALGKPAATALLNDLGGAVTFKASMVQKARFLDGDAACGCNDYWNYCGTNRHCAKDLDNCDHASSGCGFLWAYECNGKCKDDGELN